MNLGTQQRGNVLLGFVMGLVVGLGLALAVAVYITKVPVPFMNKSNPPRTLEHDVAELKKNKDWDLNAPLQGKNPVKPALAASAAVSPAAVEAAAGMSRPVPAPAPASVAAKETPKLATTADPIGDLVKAKAQTQQPPAPLATSGPDADPFTYFIQVGAYRTPEDAEQQRAKMQLLGFQTKVSEREQSGRTVYRVRLGPFDKKDEADKTKDKLEGAGVEATLVRIQR